MQQGVFKEVAAFPGNPKYEKLTERQYSLYTRQDDIRSEFARDYTRILHSLAYRRLKHKTQVFYNAAGSDHICTRIEHVAHVESVAGTIGKYLGLNLELIKAIAMGHDLGHAPFSHASEKLFVDGKKHEDYTKSILFETEVFEHINNIGEKFQKKYGKKYEITPELIWMIYEGKDVTNDKFIMPDFLFLQSFMDGELDCDKMDYLLRDSLYCGVTYGKYDLDRFISTLTVYKKDNILQLAIERGGIQALEEFVLARYFMFIQVYFHKTRRYLDRALVSCLSNLLPNGKYPESIEEYLSWNDNRVLHEISISSNPIVIDYRERKIKTCVFESKAHSDKSDIANVRIIFNLLNAEYGNKVILDSVDKAAHKLSPSILVPADDSGKGIRIIDEKTGKVSNLMEESIILDSIFKPISISRIYADKDIANEVISKISSIQSA